MLIRFTFFLKKEKKILKQVKHSIKRLTFTYLNLMKKGHLFSAVHSPQNRTCLTEQKHILK